VARYTINGGLDSSFGTGGKVITNVPVPSSDVAAGEAIQPDGKIVEVGTASVFAPDGEIVGDIALTRFNADGSVDTSFGMGGSVLTKTLLGNAGLETDERALVRFRSWLARLLIRHLDNADG